MTPQQVHHSTLEIQNVEGQLDEWINPWDNRPRQVAKHHSETRALKAPTNQCNSADTRTSLCLCQVVLVESGTCLFSRFAGTAQASSVTVKTGDEKPACDARRSPTAKCTGSQERPWHSLAQHTKRGTRRQLSHQKGDTAPLCLSRTHAKPRKSLRDRAGTALQQPGCQNHSRVLDEQSATKGWKEVPKGVKHLEGPHVSTREGTLAGLEAAQPKSEEYEENRDLARCQKKRNATERVKTNNRRMAGTRDTCPCSTSRRGHLTRADRVRPGGNDWTRRGARSTVEQQKNNVYCVFCRRCDTHEGGTCMRWKGTLYEVDMQSVQFLQTLYTKTNQKNSSKWKKVILDDSRFSL